MPDIVSRLKGTDTIPGAAVVLKQIRASQPSGSMAKTYYESKVLELLSIVMQWGENQLCHEGNNHLYGWELDSVHEVSRYLKQNYANRVPLRGLARIACMSQSKLTHSFKQVYGMTITEYIKMITPRCGDS